MYVIDFDRQKAEKKALKKLEISGKIPLSDPMLHFGYTLKFERTKRKITLQELAVEAYSHKNRLSDYETGKKMPNIRNLELLITAFIRLGANPEIADILTQAHRDTLPYRNNRTVAAVYKKLS